MNKPAVILLCLAFFTIISCENRKNKPTDTPTSGTTTIGVDETFEPIINSEINVFENIYISSGIFMKVCPEIDAFNLLLKDSVRMIIVTRKPKEEEILLFNNRKIYPKVLKIAVDGIALIVNNNNSDTLLTANNISNIITGEIKSWKEINPRSKLGDIKVVFDNVNSSTADYASRIMSLNGKIAANHSALQTNPQVIDFVSKTANALGIIGVSWVSNHKDTTCIGFLQKIRIVAVSKEEIATVNNSYQPYQAYLASGQYPYCRDLYIINTEPRTGLCTGFTSFVASDRGQRIILKSGILPATQPVRLIHVN